MLWNLVFRYHLEVTTREGLLLSKNLNTDLYIQESMEGMDSKYHRVTFWRTMLFDRELLTSVDTFVP